MNNPPRHPSTKLASGLGVSQTFAGHKQPISRIIWSHDGKRLVSASADGTVRIWDIQTGIEASALRRHNGKVLSIALTANDERLVSGTDTGTIKCWGIQSQEEYFTVRTHNSVLGLGLTRDERFIIAAFTDHTIVSFRADDGQQHRIFRGHEAPVNAVVTTIDGNRVISGSDDGTLRSWDLHSNAGTRTLVGHGGAVLDVAVSPNGRDLFSASSDASIRVWDLQTGRLIRTLEGHTSEVIALSISFDGQFLASKSSDNTLRIWDMERWATVAIVKENVQDWWQRALAFHPTESILASLASDEDSIRIWRFDPSTLRSAVETRGHRHKVTAQSQYANAKIVLVGDSGVGKSGLSLVLLGQKFQPTDSTHGRRVWLFGEDKVIDKRSKLQETREVLLWDLAGQPGYRVFHRQHLDEVAIALVLFDSKSETDPFSGVAFWSRSLDEATRGFPLVKFLVAARIDRSGPSVSYGRIKELCERYGFAGYYETSARRGDGVDELRAAIHKAIPWDYLPRVNTPELFADMKIFIVGEKEKGRVIQRRSDLLRIYSSQQVRAAKRRDHENEQDIFEVCLSRIEAAGMVKSMSFGDLVVLQPELLDDYTAWIAQAARSEPDGLGHIAEQSVRKGTFIMDSDRPLRGRQEEPLLLTATIEDVVGRGIALRQTTEDGEMLVFPSELREDIPDYPGEYVRAVAFTFEGPLKAIHSTLAVRLAHAVAFSRPDSRPHFYKNAALFKSPTGEICGFSTDYPDLDDHALGRITVFFEPETSKNTKLTFLRYVNRHLAEMAYQDTINRERVFVCECGYLFPKSAIEWCKSSGKEMIACPVGHRTYLDDLAERIEDWDALVDGLRNESLESIERDGRLTVLGDRERLNEYDVFLCHSSEDKAAVRKISARLREHGILAWLDENEILAGDLFVEKLEGIIERIRSVAIIFGSSWPSRRQQDEYESFLSIDKRERKNWNTWQGLEYYAFLQEYMNPVRTNQERLRMIPVLLPGAPSSPTLPVFLRGFSYIDFRSTDVNDKTRYRQLVHAILDTDR